MAGNERIRTPIISTPETSWSLLASLSLHTLNLISVPSEQLKKGLVGAFCPPRSCKVSAEPDVVAVSADLQFFLLVSFETDEADLDPASDA